MKKLIRSKILNPISPFECEEYEDGGILMDEEGKVLEISEFESLEGKVAEVEVVDLRDASENDGVNCPFDIVKIPKIENAALSDWLHGAIVPAFCDIHFHWVQNRVKGSFGGELLPWLKDHIWPEEARFADEKYVRESLGIFFEELKAAGTRSGVIYSSIHKEATEMAIEEAAKHGDFIIGNVLMDQNSPDYLQVETDKEIELVQYFAKKYGSRYAVTPRFAPTCSMELMRKVAHIAKENGCYIQTHLSENPDEIAWVRELFPEQKSYTNVYEEAGLLSEKTVLGHCIHLSDQEWEILARTKTFVAHCPTSNLALESGRMPVEKLIEYGIPFALGTDIGAGPKLSMIDVMEKYLAVHEGFAEIPFSEALYRATRAGDLFAEEKSESLNFLT